MVTMSLQKRQFQFLALDSPLVTMSFPNCKRKKNGGSFTEMAGVCCCSHCTAVTQSASLSPAWQNTMARL